MSTDRLEVRGAGAARRGTAPDDRGRRLFLAAVPAAVAGAWLLARGLPRMEVPTGPRVLGLHRADLYGPHDLAG
ncbi:MAG: hypothetical protein PVF91_13300 [Chromatiales bacterium]|jgi:hypothetical protein